MNPEEKEILEEILTEEEKNFLSYVAEQEVGLEAIRKVLLIPIYTYGTLKKGQKARPTANWVMNFIGNNDENLGNMVRASGYAIDYLERGLTFINHFKRQYQVQGRKEEEHI